MRRLITAALGVVLLAAGSAAAWEEPERGTETRKVLMDAVRPHVEWLLGAPVEFVVWDLRVDGEIAFFSGMAQRPGGGVIDIADTPAARWGQLDPEVGDGATVQALYRLSGETWVAVHVGVSPSERWYSWEPICREYRAVIPDACEGY